MLINNKTASSTMPSSTLRSSTQPSITPRRFGAGALAAALAMVILAPPSANAATIADSAFALEYIAQFNETNLVVIKPMIIGGNKILEVTDSAGLDGCTPVNGFANRVRCNANQVVFFSMDLGNQNDRVNVDEDLAVFTGYQLAVNGGLGDDRIIGGSGDDDLNGGSGKDNMFGGPGRDFMDGGSFDDALNGGPGRDSLRGGSGGDRINAVDQERDTIDCGLGNDSVRADPIDLVADNCEDIDLIVF